MSKTCPQMAFKSLGTRQDRVFTFNVTKLSLSNEVEEDVLDTSAKVRYLGVIFHFNMRCGPHMDQNIVNAKLAKGILIMVRHQAGGGIENACSLPLWLSSAPGSCMDWKLLLTSVSLRSPLSPSVSARRSDCLWDTLHQHVSFY